MKRNTIIAVGVLGLLLGALWLALGQRDPAYTPEAIGWSLPALVSPSRVEITQKGEAVVLVRGASGWELTAPVSAPVAPAAAAQLDRLLASGASMDHQVEAPADLSRYRLGPEAPVVALYEGDQLKAKLRLGKEEVVEGTAARRTWVQPEGAAQLYRAQGALREVLVRSADDWRERAATRFDEAEVIALEITRGEERLRLVRGEQDWSLGEPVGIALDMGAVQRLVSAAEHLQAEGFGDGLEPAAAGLRPPRARLVFTLQGKPAVALLLGSPVVAPAEAGAAPQPSNVWLQVEGSPTIYAVSADAADSLNAGLGELRSKELLNLSASELRQLTFSGLDGEPARVWERGAAGWRQTAPAAQELDPARVDALLKALTQLRAQRIVDLTPEAAGLTAPWRTITLVGAGGQTTLRLGALTVDAARYAQLNNSSPLFTLPAWTLAVLTP